MEKYDVVIAGGGPGGSYAAKTAAELGLKTVFLERARTVGEKNSSGCGLGQHWWVDFPEIMEKVEALPSFRNIRFCDFKIIDENDDLVTTIHTARTPQDENRISYKGKPRGMTGASIYRSDLDPMLADLAVQAGAELRTSTTVTDVVKEKDTVTGVVTHTGEKITGEIVIGADGAHSTVAIQSGIRKRFRKDDITLCVQLDFACDEQRMDDVLGEAERVWFGPFCGAYQVNFRDGFHLGLGQWLDIWEMKPEAFIKQILKIPAFQAMCRAVDAEMREFQVHLLPWKPRPEKTYGNGVMLIGDAGGFPCPMEAEGIWHACLTGKFAAETAAKALSSKDVSNNTLREYERKWKAPKPLGNEYTYGREFVNLWRNSAFDPVFMKKLVNFLGELQWLNGPSPIFDWSTGHMEAFNDHLGHVLDILPELGEFGKKYVAPLGGGLSDANRDKIANLLVGPVKSKLPFLPEGMIRKVVRKFLGKEEKRFL